MIWRIIGALIVIVYGSYRLFFENDKIIVVFIPILLYYLFIAGNRREKCIKRFISK